MMTSRPLKDDLSQRYPSKDIISHVRRVYMYVVIRGINYLPSNFGYFIPLNLFPLFSKHLLPILGTGNYLHDTKY